MQNEREPAHRITPHMTARARDLRKRMTIPESMLWNVLKRRQLGGLKFRKQVPMDEFVVDFYCAQANLVVELDGESHVGQFEKDEARQRRIEAKGLAVFRVTNDDVIKHLEAVADGILRAAQANLRDSSADQKVAVDDTDDE